MNQKIEKQMTWETDSHKDASLQCTRKMHLVVCSKILLFYSNCRKKVQNLYV